MKSSKVFHLILLLLFGLSGSAWAKTVTLSWDASTSTVSGYKIYYKANSSVAPFDGSGATEGGSPIDVGKVLTSTISGLPDGEEHHFTVTAYDGSGNESGYSGIVNSPAVTPPVDPPVDPPADPAVISQANWTLKYVDSQDLKVTNLYGTPDRKADYAFDGDSNSMWHTKWDLGSDPMPHEIQIDLGQSYDLNGFRYLPRQDGGINGTVAQYEFYVSTDGVNWGSPVATGTFANSTAEKEVSFSPVYGKFIRLKALSEVNGKVWTSAAEINVLGSPPSSGTPNRAPVLSSVGTKTVGEGSALSFSISGSDPDNDQLTYSASNLPSGASFNATTRQFSWTPAFEGTENTRVYSVTFTVSDGSKSDSETVTINVTNVNRAPVLAAIGNKTLNEGDSLNIVVEASDPDNNPLTYSASGLPSGAVFIPSTRSFSWIPGNDQAGTYSVTFSVADGSLSASETVSLTVKNGNEAPVLAAIGDKSIAENTKLSFTVTANDPNGDKITYSASGLPTGATFDAGKQGFSWTPDFTQAGSYTAIFTVSDGTLSASETIHITVTNTNQAPTITGAPASSVMAGSEYSFTPTASDPDGDQLSFTISNKPAWATFDQASGQLSGTPGDQHVGNSAAIVISVSDGVATAPLTSFAIEVEAYVAQDSDGDGVLDHLDPFPNDSTEWLDSDGDLIGNNADEDDDNDGILDAEDGFPLDAAKSSWMISATAGTGGFITPEGETAVVYGGSLTYTLTPKAGYAVETLLVDNVSVGSVGSYQFTNVSAHHSIEAIFIPLPSGLSVEVDADGLDGVERVDGADERSNLVDGKPKLDIDYIFKAILRDSVKASERKVFLHLDGYRYEMQLAEGALASGADYVFTTRMGPANSHSFYFTAEDSNGNQLYRYPQSGDLPGPTIELLNGKNVIAVSADIDQAALDSQGAFQVSQVYRWVPSTKLNGSYEQVDRSGPVICTEGYVLKRTAGVTLPNYAGYGEIAAATKEIQVKPGWNLIANPYQGNVSLADVQVRHGNAAPVDWLTAASNKLVIDGVYYYLGKDWGNSHAFESAAGPQAAVLTPWIGYWIYVNPTDQQVTLLIPKPQQ